MASPTNHWKLGLFVVVGLVLTLCTIVFLGARSLHKDSVHYKSYFDESVQGLEVGSAIKFRGVPIGSVSAIDIAPDGRHVMVTTDLSVQDLSDLGLADGTGMKSRIRIPPELRVELASQGITGVKFLQLDFFNVISYPVPVLPFPTPPNYIPSVVSTMKNLETAVVKAVDRMPELADSILKVTTQVGRILDQVEKNKLPDAATDTLANTNKVLAAVQGAVTDLNAGKISGKAQQAMADFSGTMKKVDAMIARVDSDKGLLVSAKRATDAVGDIATNFGSPRLSGSVEKTLGDIQEVAEYIRKIADALERDPDMLMKGKGKPK
jgi:phospholipid/cholesterol/gamma-HCH transport system substrate-binding protein